MPFPARFVVEKLNRAHAPVTVVVPLGGGSIIDGAELDRLAASGAVGDLALNFFDADGRPVRSSADGRVVGLSLEELRAIPGVTDVKVDLVSGATSQVTITSDAPISDDAIKGAVEEAGYAVAPPRSLL